MLRPVSTFERAAEGLFLLQNGISVEGGIVGEIVAGVGRQQGNPVVAIYDDGGGDGYGSTTVTDLVGLIDDSTTGTKDSGNGNTGMIGKIQPFNSAATAIGPSSTLGSGKCTIWLQSGLFITDQFATSITTATACGTALFASSTGKLTSTAGSKRIGTVLKVAAGGPTSFAGINLFSILPRVQPLPASTVLMLFKFK